MKTTFEQELQELLNRHNIDGLLGMPDFIVSAMVMRIINEIIIAKQTSDKLNARPTNVIISDPDKQFKPAPAVVKPPWSPSPTFPRDTPQPYMKDL